jgi:hypothetical protein
MQRNSFSLAQTAADDASDEEARSSRPGRANSELHSLEVELGCARALLDELEAALEREYPERARGDMIIQVAEELERTATAMKQWAMDRVRNCPLERRRD